MAKVSVELNENFIYSAELTVRVSDLNYGAHLGHDSVLTLFQEARIMFYRSIGFRDEISFDGQVGHVIADAALQYKSEAFLGDLLEVRISIGDITKYGFEMFYQMLNRETGKEVARGKTGMVCFDFSKRRVAPVPSVLLNQITKGKQNL